MTLIKCSKKKLQKTKQRLHTKNFFEPGRSTLLIVPCSLPRPAVVALLYYIYLLS